VRSPKLDKVGFHTVEVINPGGKRYRLDDVLYYTDDPALLGQDATTSASNKPTKPKERSSAARRVSGFFGRASVSASSSPTVSQDRIRETTMRRAESTDNLETTARGDATATPKFSVLPTVVRTSTTGVDTGTSREEEAEPDSDVGKPWSFRSAQGVVTKPSRQQRSPSPPTISFGAMTIGDFTEVDPSSSSRGGADGRPAGGRPPVGSGHARSVSLDQSAFARGGSPLTPAATIGGGGVGRGGSGFFWNAIDPSSVSAPSSPSLSSSVSATYPAPPPSRTPTSRLRWGAPNKN
jgi:hypothetical protein